MNSVLSIVAVYLNCDEVLFSPRVELHFRILAFNCVSNGRVLLEIGKYVYIRWWKARRV